MDDKESESELRQIVLALNFPVDCHKYIESMFGVGKELAVLTSAPSNLDHRPARMARKRGTHSCMNALV